MDNLLEIAKIGKSFGIKGDLYIYPFTDDVHNFVNYQKFFLKSKLNNLDELNIELYRFHKNNLVVKFSEINSKEEAKLFANMFLYIPKDWLAPLEEDQYYIKDLIGCTVYTNDLLIGTLLDVKNFGTCDLFEIDKDNEIIYIPFEDNYVGEICIDRKKIVLLDVEEFLD